MESVFGLLLDITLGAAAFRLAWSVDRSQKQMVQVQIKQTEILRELTTRVERLEIKVG